MKYHWTLVNFCCTLAGRCFVCALFTCVLLHVVGAESGCGGDINLNKTISIKSPQYPNFAPHGIKCSWRISSINRKSIVVQWIDLDLGSVINVDDCNNGMLEIFNGCDNGRFLVEKICLRHSDVQKGIHELWLSSGSCVTINFSSGQRKDNKFHLSVAESVASCGDKRILGTNTGNKNHTFVGTLPANPGINNKCVWIIVVNTGRIELVFKAKFRVTSHTQDCKENFVQVQDGRFSTAHVLGTFCGTSRPYPVYSTGRYLRVTLHGSKSGLDTRHTFRAQYTNVDSTPAAPAAYCDGDIFLPSTGGTFQTPLYPGQYPADLRCIWKIEAAENDKIILRFREFDVEGDSQGCPDDSDYAQVFNGLASWSPSIGRYCGSVIPASIESKTNKLRIEFQSNGQYAGRGFDAVFTVQSDEKAGQTRNPFTGIMIGTTCGIIFIVLSALAIFHTQKLRRHRAQSRRSEVASTASFDVHQANAPPSYETVMASPDLFPSKERQTSRGYAGAPHLHQEISHLLGDPESDDEDLPPYPGLSSRDGTIEFCFGPAPVEGRRSPKERHVSESEQPSCQISAVWYRRGPGAAPSSPNVRDLDSASENQATTLERQHSKETSRPRLERMDTSSSFVTDV